MIIDGIDVSGCNYYSPTHDILLKIKNYCYAEGKVCVNTNCYYKQLQRAKAEIEKLKKQCMQMVDENYATTDWREMEDLKAENERLKENLKLINASVTHIVEGDDDISLGGICEELAKIKKNSEVLND